MKKVVSIAFSLVLGLTTASAISLAQSVSTAGSHQPGHQPQAGVRIFINDRLLTENVIEITPAASSRLPIPFPKRKAADPTPFPLTGEIYIPVMDLAAALNGHKTLEPHLKIEGAKLYARKHVGQPKYEDFSITVNSDGLISSALRELKGKDGRPMTSLPLNDLVKALGGEVKKKLELHLPQELIKSQSKEIHQTEVHANDKEILEITASPGTTSLLSPVQKQ